VIVFDDNKTSNFFVFPVNDDDDEDAEYVHHFYDEWVEKNEQTGLRADHYIVLVPKTLFESKQTIKHLSAEYGRRLREHDEFKRCDCPLNRNDFDYGTYPYWTNNCPCNTYSLWANDCLCHHIRIAIQSDLMQLRKVLDQLMRNLDTLWIDSRFLFSEVFPQIGSDNDVQRNVAECFVAVGGYPYHPWRKFPNPEQRAAWCISFSTRPCIHPEVHRFDVKHDCSGGERITTVPVSFKKKLEDEVVERALKKNKIWSE